jgi:hypothetical protein
MLLRLTEVLGVADFADLTGDQSLPVASITKAAHPVTPAVTDTVLRAASDVRTPALRRSTISRWTPSAAATGTP